MPRFPAILDRFRRLIAPPGRPSAALGVPAGGDDVLAELGPLLGELDAVGREAARIEEEARVEAGRRREQAIREVAAIVEEARSRADGERIRAAARWRDHTRALGGDARVTAREEADRIRARAEERTGELVAEVVECVRDTGR